jgi:[pyruvate, water dikinase]-phosphate phosphotransferase / [pyruvate, water dikinase] kinase
MNDNPETKNAGTSSISIFIVSDATGGTALRMVRSALVQFGDMGVELIQHTHVNTPQRVQTVVDEATRKKSLILHTIVSSDLRRLMLQQSRLAGIDAMDLMGPVLDRLSVFLNRPPIEEPGLYKHLAEGKSREIAAVEFAFRHDDGRKPEDLPSAEIVLVGISRSLKTPTTLYLAYHGWFTANVPLILEVQPPYELFSVPSEKVFCLVMAESRLLELRQTRASATNLPHGSYVLPEYIRDEISYAKKLCRDYKWQLIDTTGKSIEEIAREILELRPELEKKPLPD